jgi:flavin reductase (DIM6/NTAB) family NADH-FMN oxidoreductase RutF
MFYSKEAQELSTKEIYFFLIGAISPRPIAWVSTVNKEGQTNLAPFSFFNAFSSNPPVVIFSPAVSPDPDRPYKDTYLNLIETKECVVNLVNYELCEQMNLSSKDLEYGQSEFDFAKLETLESDLIKAPRVKEAPVQLECKLMEMKQLGDKPGAGNLAICEVVKFHFKENIFKEGTTRIDANALDAVGRNGEYYYTRASGEALFEIKRPN